MVKPSIIADKLLLEVEGADKIWSLKSHLEISLTHITSVRLDPDVANSWHRGIKMTGSFIPHVITAGTFYQAGQRIFWDIHHPDQAVVISLAYETYSELIIEVENPAIFVAQLTHALAKK